MGFFDSLLKPVNDLLGPIFGSPEPEMRQASLYTPGQTGLLNKLLELITPQVGQGVEPYPGTTVPGSNAMLDQLMSMAGGYTGSPLYTGASSVLERTLNASPDYGATRDYWTEAFLEPTLQQFKRDILPSIREQNVGQGTYRSGGRLRAETGALGDVMTNLSGQLANLMFGEQQSALDRALQAVPMAQQHMGGAMDVLSQVGLLERGMEGEKLGEDYSKWAMSQPYANPWLNMAMPLLNQRTFENYMYQPAPSPLQTIGQTALGAGGTMAGLGGGMWLGNKLMGGGTDLGGIKTTGNVGNAGSLASLTQPGSSPYLLPMPGVMAW